MLKTVCSLGSQGHRCSKHMDNYLDFVFGLHSSSSRSVDSKNFKVYDKMSDHFQVSILRKSIAGRYRPVRVADGPITARCRFLKNASWVRVSIITNLPRRSPVVLSSHRSISK